MRPSPGTPGGGRGLVHPRVLCQVHELVHHIDASAAARIGVGEHVAKEYAAVAARLVVGRRGKGIGGLALSGTAKLIAGLLAVSV